MPGILEGKVALITGAGSGIGREASRVFAREGAKLVLADVVEEGGQQTLATIKDTGHDAVFIRADISKEAEVEAAIAKATATYGWLDCAFNNAGIEGEGSHTHDCTRENWDRVIAIDLTGVWLCMKAEIALFLNQGKGGAIVNTSSVAGICGVTNMPAYVAAKHGVVGLTRAAALEYGRNKIRINAVCPGPIRTPMLGRLADGREQAEERFSRGIAIKRLGEANDIAEAAAWLCSDHAPYVTGLAMPVDGGFSAR